MRIDIIEESNNPLSSKCFIIYGKNNYIYDVGANPLNIAIIKQVLAPTIILSHFHNDHIENAKRITGSYIVSAQTKKYIDGETTLLSNDEIEVFKIPSSHAKGSLGLFIKENKLCLIGDSIYPNQYGAYNRELLRQQIIIFEGIDATVFVPSHGNKTFTKNEILTILKKILAKFQKNENIKEFSDDDLNNLF